MATHRYLARGLVENNRDLTELLESGNKFFIYAGRFHVSEPLNLRDLASLFLARDLQQGSRAPVVILVKYDAKLKWTSEKKSKCLKEYLKSILACGLERERTFFLTSSLPNRLYREIVKVTRVLPLAKVESRVERKDAGALFYAVVEAVFCRLSQTFLGETFNKCLAIGQDKFAGLIPDLSEPVAVQLKPLPTLQGELGKTSTHDDNWAIFLTDAPQTVKFKIHKHTLSGGGATIKEHMENGANLEVDVPYKYLTFFLEDDEEFAKITTEYGSGRKSTGDVKATFINLAKKLLECHKTAYSSISDEVSFVS